MMDRNHRIANQVYRNPDYFVLKASGRHLRSYQREVLNAIIQSIRQKAGRSFVVIFSRQSGKNELQSHLFAYLLAVLSRFSLNIVSVSPTFNPQALHAMGRLEKVLSHNLFTRHVWKRRHGFKYCLGSSRVVFLSGDSSASVVGETAHILLSVDEAQSFEPVRFDKIFSPMAAAHNATRVFWGTSWTSTTLLARERRRAELAQQADGIRRVWIVPGDVVAEEVPSYAAFLKSEIDHLGRNHPIVRSQYFCEEIDAQVGMFTPGRLALMQADECAQTSPPISGFHAPSSLRGEMGNFDGHSLSSPPISGVEMGGCKGGRPYAFLLDVAGQDESRMKVNDDSPLTNSGRDACSLTIVSIDLSSLPILQAPTFRFVNRQQWIGLNHLVLFGKLKSLTESWRPQYIAIDATGVGEGLWSMLDKAFPGRVIPVKFSQQVKSEIGWRYIAMIETGRVRDCCGGLASSEHRPRPPHEGWTRMTDLVLAQYQACQAEIMPGPGKVLRWGVPEGARGSDGELIHDDYLLADALVAELDKLEWIVSTDVSSSDGFDPLEFRV